VKQLSYYNSVVAEIKSVYGSCQKKPIEALCQKDKFILKIKRIESFSLRKSCLSLMLSECLEGLFESSRTCLTSEEKAQLKRKSASLVEELLSLYSELIEDRRVHDDIEKRNCG